MVEFGLKKPKELAIMMAQQYNPTPKGITFSSNLGPYKIKISGLRVMKEQVILI